MVSVLLVKVAGVLRVGALAFAPHVADPRLLEMRCGWQPRMTSYCGRVGKVIEADEYSVKLYSCGSEIWWDITLFDSCLRRFCHKGCCLEHKVVASRTCICKVCLARVPVGAPNMRCDEHDYAICTYCLGQPSLSSVGMRVIRGPTWSGELPVEGYEDYYEEGVVETDLLDDISLARESDNIEMPRRSYHSYFQASMGCVCERRSNLSGGCPQDILGHFSELCTVKCSRMPGWGSRGAVVEPPMFGEFTLKLDILSSVVPMLEMTQGSVAEKRQEELLQGSSVPGCDSGLCQRPHRLEASQGSASRPLTTWAGVAAAEKLIENVRIN